MWFSYRDRGLFYQGLNGEVISSAPAACPTGFTEASLVFLSHGRIGTQLESLVIAPCWVAVAVGLSPLITVLNGVSPCLVPGCAVAGELEEILLHSGSHVALLRGHVLGVLLVRQAVLRKGDG